MDKNEIIKDFKTNNKFLSSKFEKSSLLIKLAYEINKKKYIKLFGYKFFNRNKRKLKIIINNKLCNLTNNFKKISNNNMKVLKIKLLLLNEPKINFSQMFYNCSSLNNFSIITKDEPISKNKIIEEQNDNSIKSLNFNNSEEINRQSSIDLYLLNRSSNNTEKINTSNNTFNFSDYKTKSQYSFYFSNKNDISEDKKEQISKILFHSHNFLFPFSSFDSLLFQYNINDNKLINTNLFSSIFSVLLFDLLKKYNSIDDFLFISSELFIGNILI